MKQTTKKMNRHPLSTFFADMPEEEFNEFRADIKENGVEKPIVLFEDQILDGWHRYKATQELDIACPYVNFEEIANGSTVQEFVIRQNKMRKHLTKSQIAFAITQVSAWKPVGRGIRKEIGHSVSNFSTQEIAEKAGVHDSTIKQAKQVIRDGSNKLKEAVKDGSIGLNKASEISKLPKKDQAKAINKPLPKKELNEVEQALEDSLPDFEELMQENIDLQERIISLTQSDKDKEILKLYEQLEVEKQRADRYQNEAHEMQRQLKSYNSMYKRICKVTGLEKFSDIVQLITETFGSK